MKVLQEFKSFALKGNVVDMAVGIIIGAAFGKIISSAVSEMLMPPIGKLIGNVNFSDLFISLDPEKTAGIQSLTKAKETGAAIIAYGSFLNVVIDFVIVAACMFFVVKVMNTLQVKQAAAPTTKQCPYCCSAIPLAATKCGCCTSAISNG